MKIVLLSTKITRIEQKSLTEIIRKKKKKKQSY